MKKLITANFKEWNKIHYIIVFSPAVIGIIAIIAAQIML